MVPFHHRNPDPVSFFIAIITANYSLGMVCGIMYSLILYVNMFSINSTQNKLGTLCSFESVYANRCDNVMHVGLGVDINCMVM